MFLLKDLYSTAKIEKVQGTFDKPFAKFKNNLIMFDDVIGGQMLDAYQLV